MKKILLLLAVFLLIGCDRNEKCTSPTKFKGCEVMSISNWAVNGRIRLKLTDSLAVVYEVDYKTIIVPSYEVSKYHCGDIIE